MEPKSIFGVTQGLRGALRNENAVSHRRLSLQPVTIQQLAPPKTLALVGADISPLLPSLKAPAKRFVPPRAQEPECEKVNYYREYKLEQLPFTLMTVGGTPVEQGGDPGDATCEHLFYSAQEVARGAQARVLRNGSGEPLVGFLHIPKDDYSAERGLRYTLDERHAKNRVVVGTALRGYIQEIRAQRPGEPASVLITGFGAYSLGLNNPSGEFVRFLANIDAAMAIAFPGRLIDAAGQPTTEGEIVGARPLGTGHTLRYRVDGDPAFEVRVTVQCLPAEAAATDPTHELSVQRAAVETGAQAILSLGKGTEEIFLVENHADNREHPAFPEAEFCPTDTLPHNFSLARALLGSEKR